MSPCGADVDDAKLGFHTALCPKIGPIRILPVSLTPLVGSENCKHPTLLVVRPLCNVGQVHAMAQMKGEFVTFRKPLKRFIAALDSGVG